MKNPRLVAVAVCLRAAFLWLALALLWGCSALSEPFSADPGADAGADACAPGAALEGDAGCVPAGLPPDMPCHPGELLLTDGRCQPAGLPLDMPCLPGELLLEDGRCQAAGIPPEACGQGFVPDGEGSCQPILPKQECPEGQMATPGQSACHEVAPCGDRTYGNIPVEPGTQFVRKDYPGSDSDGTQEKPWTTIQAGITAAKAGALVAVAAGTYPEDLLLQDKAVRVWGRCPRLVSVVGSGAQIAAIQILNKLASKSLVRGLAVTGKSSGILVSGARFVQVEEVWIHDNEDRGLEVEHVLGPTSVTVQGALLSRNHAFGVYVSGSDATVGASLVEDTLPDANGQFGWGIAIKDDPATKARANLTLRTCRIAHNHEVGAFVGGSDATVEASLLSDTLPAANGQFGWGIAIEDDPATKARAKVTLRACHVAHNHESGVFVLGSDATVEASLVEDTLPAANGQGGWGIAIEDDPATKARANVTLRASHLANNHEIGVLVEGSDATVEACLIEDTLPLANGQGGHGIQIQDDPATKARANVSLRACRIAHNHDVGVVVAGSDATVEASLVEDTLPLANGQGGLGISIEDDPATKARANVTLRACRIAHNHEVGVFVEGSDATVEASLVEDTLPKANGQGGLGISIEDDPATKARANVTLRACRIAHNHDVGVVVAGSDATVEASLVENTLPTTNRQHGRGIQIQYDPDTKLRAKFMLLSSLVTENYEFGLAVVSSEATVRQSVVRNTAARSDGLFGDGVAVLLDDGPASATLLHTEVVNNKRAGVSNFGAQVSIVSSVLSCNGFDLDAEDSNGTSASFPDSDDDLCDCPVPTDSCHAVSSHLTPPAPLDPLAPAPTPP